MRNTLTEAEHDELDAWVVASEENTRLFEELTDEENIEAGLQWQKGINEYAALDKIKEELGIKKKRAFQSTAGPYLAAISLVAFLLVLFLFRNNKETLEPTASSHEPIYS